MWSKLDVGQHADLAVRRRWSVPGPAQTRPRRPWTSTASSAKCSKAADGEQLEAGRAARRASGSSSGQLGQDGSAEASSPIGSLVAARCARSPGAGSGWCRSRRSRPLASSRDVTMAEVEPLPLVPVTWMDGIGSLGVARASVERAARRSRRRQQRAGRGMSLEVDVVVEPGRAPSPKATANSRRLATGRSGGGAAGAGRLDRRAPSGTSVGCDPVEHHGAVDHALAHVGAARAGRTSRPAAPLRGWPAGHGRRCRAAAPARPPPRGRRA